VPVDLTGVRAAARETGIPRGTLIGRMRSGLSLEEAIRLGVRARAESNPRSPERLAMEAAGVPRTTARRRAAQGLPPAVVLDPRRLRPGEVEALARAAFLDAAIVAGISLELSSALPTEARSVLQRWSALSLSERVLWVLRDGPRLARSLERLLGEDHRRIGNVLSGLRTRGMVREGGRTHKPGGYGPKVVPLWTVTEAGSKVDR